MKKFLPLIFHFLIIYGNAQNSNPTPDINTITTSVPFLLINPNAQSMGIGDIGVVAAKEYYESGLTQNPALLARGEKLLGFKASYKPWLRNLVPDINMLDAGFYYSINKKITLGYSFNLFSLGTLTLYDANNYPYRDVHAKEFAHNLRYAQTLTPHLSAGIGLKYIVSDLTNGFPIKGQPTQKGRAFAADLGVDYRKEFAKKDNSFWRYNIGGSILNIGNKIDYGPGNDLNFLPMQLAAGIMLTYTKDINATRYAIDLAYQGEKLLVPTPPIYSINANGQATIVKGKDPNVSVVKGAFQSFLDAPDGIREEMTEIIHKVGVENRLTFNEKLGLKLRLGMMKEHERKGNRHFFNLGMGIRYKSFYLDYATILLYRWSGFMGQSTYQFVPLNPFSYCLTLGFKYTFKGTTDSDSETE